MAAMSDSPAVTPIPVRDEDLAQVRYNDDGLVAAIVQDVADRRRADDGVDERRDAAHEPRAGPHRVLVAFAPGGVAQGRHLG